MTPAVAPAEAPPQSQVPPGVIEAMIERARTTPSGPFVEVGVFQGGTAWHLAKLAEEQGRELWLYDTFAGIPFQGPNDSHKIGDFAGCSFEEVKRRIPYARVVQGIYPQSAHGTLWEPKDQIAFAHIDCDQQRSYRETIEYLRTRMARGGVMWFDDAPCLPGAKIEVLHAFSPEMIHETVHKWWVEFP